jgi:hypothetical protein
MEMKNIILFILLSVSVMDGMVLMRIIGQNMKKKMHTNPIEIAP